MPIGQPGSLPTPVDELGEAIVKIIGDIDPRDAAAWSGLSSKYLAKIIANPRAKPSEEALISLARAVSGSAEPLIEIGTRVRGKLPKTKNPGRSAGKWSPKTMLEQICFLTTAIQYANAAKIDARRIVLPGPQREPIDRYLFGNAKMNVGGVDAVVGALGVSLDVLREASGTAQIITAFLVAPDAKTYDPPTTISVDPLLADHGIRAIEIGVAVQTVFARVQVTPKLKIEASEYLKGLKGFQDAEIGRALADGKEAKAS